MAEKLCELRKKGGGSQYTETSLWTNPSPSSNFAAQTVSLSSSINNYKYIKVKFKFETTSTADAQNGSFIVSVDDFKKATYNAYNNVPIYMIGSANTSLHFARYFEYVSDTSVYISTAYTVNNANNNNSRSIPLEILGLNELDHAGEDPLNPDEVKSGTKNTGSNTVTITFASNIQRIVMTHSNRYYVVKEGDDYWQYDSTGVNPRSSKTGSISVNGNTVTLSGTWSTNSPVNYVLLAWFY